jgi:hypothetical protein
VAVERLPETHIRAEELAVSELVALYRWLAHRR